MTFKEFTKVEIDLVENSSPGISNETKTFENNNTSDNNHISSEDSNNIDSNAFNDNTSFDYNLEGESLW